MRKGVHDRHRWINKSEIRRPHQGTPTLLSEQDCWVFRFISLGLGYLGNEEIGWKKNRKKIGMQGCLSSGSSSSRQRYSKAGIDEQSRNEFKVPCSRHPRLRIVTWRRTVPCWTRWSRLTRYTWWSAPKWIIVTKKDFFPKRVQFCARHFLRTCENGKLRVVTSTRKIKK